MFYLAILITGFALTLALTPLAGRVGVRLGLVDRPGGRRRHRGVIPRTGGLAIFGGFVITLLLTLIVPEIAPASWQALFPPRNDPNEARRLAALLAGSVFCVVAGFVDDRYELGAGPQYAVQVGAALIACAGLVFIKHINNPFGEGFFFGPEGLPFWLVIPLTLFWFVGMMNTINWLDGLSGLVSDRKSVV